MSFSLVRQIHARSDSFLQYRLFFPRRKKGGSVICHVYGSCRRMAWICLNHIPSFHDETLSMLETGFTAALKDAVRHRSRHIALYLSIHGIPVDEKMALRAALEAIEKEASSADLDIQLICRRPSSRSNLSPESFKFIHSLNNVPDKSSELNLCLFQLRQDVKDMLRNYGNFPAENHFFSDDCQLSFRSRLFQRIDERHMTDSEVYKKANLSRKLFSKIRCNPQYMPRKRTILALAIALELDLSDTLDLLARAGYTMSFANDSDIIVAWFILNGMYSINDINFILYDHNFHILGS